MTEDQLDDFIDFGESTLVGWTLPFYLPKPWGGGNQLVRFGESLPSISSQEAGYWKVNLSLEILQ